MRQKLLWAFALWAIVPMALAAQEDQSADTPAEQYQALVNEYQAEYNTFMEKYQAAKTPDERTAIIQEMPDRMAYAAKFLDLAKANADDASAVDALIWVISNGMGSPVAGDATKILAKDHYKSDKIGSVMQALTRSPGQPTEDFLRKVITDNENEEIQALAVYSLGGYLKQMKGYAEMLNDETRGPLIRNSFGEEVATYLGRLGKNGMIDEEIEQLYETVAEKFGDIPHNNSTMGELVARELFEIRNLSVGKVAPEIEGEDVEGETFKLSDYRGKVVMLDFWGDW